MTVAGPLLPPSSGAAPRRVLAPEAMRRADAEAIRAGLPGLALMEMAGAACARAAWAHWPDRLRASGAVVVAGKGNNGGDGYVVARHLLARGVRCRVWAVGDPGPPGGDAAFNRARAEAAGVPVTPLSGPGDLEELSRSLGGAGVVVDALLGTGLGGTPQGLVAEAIARIAACPVPVLAVDVPSGVDGATGAVPGRAVRADVTVTFAAAKWGHLLHPGAALSGRVEVAEIGLDAEVLDREADGEALSPSDLPVWLPRRRRDAHKGDFGHVLVVAGSASKPGAAVLAAMGALRAGAGLVTLAVPEGAVLPGLGPEVMVERVPAESGAFGAASLPALEALLAGKDAFALGPGLGQAAGTRELARAAVRSWPLPGSVDADALNALAGDPRSLAEAAAPRVITPHPGEAGRLLGRSAGEVNADRPAAARALAALGPSVVAVLKGAGTLVARPGGPVAVVASGNPGMASGGSGDVLTGMVAAMLARRLEPAAAAAAAALWHGLAGDVAAAAVGEESLAATDLVAHLGAALRAARAGGLVEPLSWR